MDHFERLGKQFASKVFCGLGSVIVPSGVDRESYIATCFATETLSILPEGGGMSYNNVPVSLEAIQHIEFPEPGNTFGSQVVYLFHPKTKFPVVIAVIDKKSELFGVQPKHFKFFKTEGENFVSVDGDGKRGNLYVSVNGSEDVSGGQIHISVCNGTNKGLLSLSVQGDIQVIHSNLSVVNMTTKIDSKEKISLGSDNYEPLVLGNSLVDNVLKPLLDALSTLKVATAVGPSGVPLPDFVAKVSEIKGTLDTILSKKTETE